MLPQKIKRASYRQVLARSLCDFSLTARNPVNSVPLQLSNLDNNQF